MLKPKNEERLNYWDALAYVHKRLAECQRELHIARYLAEGVQLKTGPSPETRRQHVAVAEQSVKDALDRMHEATKKENLQYWYCRPQCSSRARRRNILEAFEHDAVKLASNPYSSSLDAFLFRHIWISLRILWRLQQWLWKLYRGIPARSICFQGTNWLPPF